MTLIPTRVPFILKLFSLPGSTSNSLGVLEARVLLMFHTPPPKRQANSKFADSTPVDFCLQQISKIVTLKIPPFF